MLFGGYRYRWVDLPCPARVVAAVLLRGPLLDVFGELKGATARLTLATPSLDQAHALAEALTAAAARDRLDRLAATLSPEDRKFLQRQAAAPTAQQEPAGPVYLLPSPLLLGDRPPDPHDGSGAGLAESAREPNL